MGTIEEKNKVLRPFIITINCFIIINVYYNIQLLIPVAARSKAWVFGRSPAGIVDSNPTGGMDVCLLCVVR